MSEKIILIKLVKSWLWKQCNIFEISFIIFDTKFLFSKFSSLKKPCCEKRDRSTLKRRAIGREKASSASAVVERILMCPFIVTGVARLLR